MGYRWRHNGRTMTNIVLHSHQAFYTVTNAAPEDAGLYTVVLTNAIYYQPGILRTSAMVTVLLDTDRDGLPDEWELAYGLDPDVAADALQDPDRDDRTNWEEYHAGTDPLDSASAFRVEEIQVDDRIRLRFPAMSNRTYTVQCQDRFAAGEWTKLNDVVASPTNRTVLVTDLPDRTNRYYRVRTPRQP